MENKNFLENKTILSGLAIAQKVPGLRALFKLVTNLLLRGRIRSLDDLEGRSEFTKAATKLNTQEANIYNKALVPIGFPTLLTDAGKVTGVIQRGAGRRITRLAALPSKDRVNKALEQHIDFLQEESLFQKAHKQAKNLRVTDRSPQARQFYQDYALSFGVNYRSMDMLRTGGRKISNMLLGRMYYFRYEPEIPDDIYDNYPLIFMLYEDPDNFSGINFHYLTPKQRAVLLGKMFVYLNNENYDQYTRLIARTFRNRIMTDKRFRYAKSAYRQYRPDRITSKIIQVHPLDWELAISVPTERFKSIAGSRLPSKPIWFKNTRRAKTL